MSRVFVAEEVELERSVVVKVLPPDLAAGLNVDRFRREIQLAAKLQHPHIVPLLAGGAHGALLYYTMPFIDGQSLREKLAKSRELPVYEAVKILIEIADALAYAHSHGVVHRDIKPENVLLAGKHAFVTDFGVARALSNATGQASLTSIGMALGTPAYMAPEQAAADPLVDHRADIYALGVVGYELLTGRTPFAGLTPQMMLSAQVATAPDDITKYRPNVPPQLGTVIMQCLYKNPADRLQSAEEVRARLEAMTASGGIEAVSVKSHAKRTAGVRITPQRIGVLAAAVALSAAGLFAAFTAFRGGDEALLIAGMTQITNATGLEMHPAISPDGRTVAFVSGVPGNTSLFIRQVGGGRSVRLTEDADGNVAWPLWSPDGAHLSYTRASEIWSVPALGGRPMLLVRRPDTVAVTNGGWSPDGTHLAYSAGDTLYVANADGTNPRKIGSVPAPHAIAWSPDGSKLASASGNARFLLGGPGSLGNIAAGSIWVLSTSGRPAVAATDETRLRTSPVWSTDGRHLLFVSATGGIRDIYQLRIDGSGKPRGEAVRLTTGLNPHSISLSRDGKLLAYSRFETTSNVYALPISTRGAVITKALRPITSGNQVIEAMSLSRDGRWLAFDSNISGNQDIYKLPLTGGEPEQLTRDPSDDFEPAWSPDGRQIAFHSLRNGDRDLFVVSAEGGPATEVVKGPGQQLAASWSPTGDAMVFTTRSSFAGAGTVAIVERNASGSTGWRQPRQLTGTLPFSPARWSSDGNLIAFNSAAGIAVVSPRGEAMRIVFPAGKDTPFSSYVAWAPDSRTLYYASFAPSPTWWMVPVEGGSPTKLFWFPDPARQPFRPVFAVDERNFYVTIGSRESDVWVMELTTK